nr:cupredoxin domain-containing protein [uncultured Rhodopila sp.]
MKQAVRILAAAMAFAAPALAANPWAQARVVTVVMVDNQFEPDHLTFHSGQPYELRLENRGKDMHEFTAPAFLKAAKVRDKRKLANGGTDIVVSSGTSVRIFLIPGPKGHYDLTCADHDWDGMVGGITVD